MLNFLCKKNLLHSFLGFPNRFRNDNNNNNPESGLSLISSDCRKPDNVLESAFVKKPLMMEEEEEEGRGIKKVNSENSNGKFDYCGGNGGLSSCTESLGFESSDQMEKEEEEEEEKLLSKSIVQTRLIRSDEELVKEKKNKVFPPPLSSLNENGKPNFFLKPIRKDGRLELMEVPINHPDQIFLASRQDGRLRLQFIISDISEEQEITEEEEELEEEEEEELKEEEEEIEDDSNNRELNFPLMGNSGEGFRRCHEFINNHHLHMWKQHEVTNRSTVHVL